MTAAASSICRPRAAGRRRGRAEATVGSRSRAACARCSPPKCWKRWVSRRRRHWSLFETGERLSRGDEPSLPRAFLGPHARDASEPSFRVVSSATRTPATPSELDALLQFAVKHYLPETASGPGDLPTRFLGEVARRTAATCASFMVAGFVHGVLNTDNMNVTGESFDYGPYRFLPHYDPAFTAAYFDHGGLYAFGRQPRAMVTNLMRLADALRPLSPTAAFAPALREFEPAFHVAMQRGICRRLGLVSNGTDLDTLLTDAVYAFLDSAPVGYDQFFFDWYGGLAARDRAMKNQAGHRTTGVRSVSRAGDGARSLFAGESSASHALVFRARGARVSAHRRDRSYLGVDRPRR